MHSTYRQHRNYLRSSPPPAAPWTPLLCSIKKRITCTAGLNIILTWYSSHLASQARLSFLPWPQITFAIAPQKHIEYWEASYLPSSLRRKCTLSDLFVRLERLLCVLTTSMDVPVSVDGPPHLTVVADIRRSLIRVYLRCWACKHTWWIVWNISTPFYLYEMLPMASAVVWDAIIKLISEVRGPC